MKDNNIGCVRNTGNGTEIVTAKMKASALKLPNRTNMILHIGD